MEAIGTNRPALIEKLREYFLDYLLVLQDKPVVYKLYAVLVHSGFSCNSGHYYCYVKAANGIWYEMNDSRVSYSL